MIMKYSSKMGHIEYIHVSAADPESFQSRVVVEKTKGRVTEAKVLVIFLFIHFINMKKHNNLLFLYISSVYKIIYIVSCVKINLNFV